MLLSDTDSFISDSFESIKPRLEKKIIRTEVRFKNICIMPY